MCVLDTVSFVLFYFLIGITSICVYVIGKCFMPIKPSIGNSRTYILINLLKDKFKNFNTWYNVLNVLDFSFFYTSYYF